MMKRLLLSFALICICAMLRAQDFKVVSMSALPMDMTAREHIKVDDNDRKCAVIRIATQNISLSQRKGFHFESDWGSNVVERTLQDGEILVWVSPGLKTLKIKHENLGKWELHTADYGITVEPLHTYKVVLQGTVAPNPDENQEVAQQYLTFQITPANAVLEVNGELWEVGQDGSALKFVDFGTYDYVVKAPNYHSESGTVTVDDPEKTQKVEVRLKSDLVEVTLAVDADAEIWVNNEKKGVRTWTGALGKGTYKIECKQAGHQSSVTTKEITANMAGKAITLPVPKPIHGSLNVESTPSEAKIYIDGKEVGETPKFMKEILVGEHRLKLTKDGYENHEESFVIKKNERTQLTAKLQMENNLRKENTVESGSCGTYGGHDYVDLGLPSGTLWATCNVGASFPEEGGNYYAWGETVVKSKYLWEKYKFGDIDKLNKYCNNTEYGKRGFTDSLTILISSDDAAMHNWGDGWCMPSKEQWEELKDNTTVTWITQNGVKGLKFTALNGNCLFLPASGNRRYIELDDAGEWGEYWSRSLCTEGNPGLSWGFSFSSNKYGVYGCSRPLGFSIRPVRSSPN